MDAKNNHCSQVELIKSFDESNSEFTLNNSVYNKKIKLMKNRSKLTKSKLNIYHSKKSIKDRLIGSFKHKPGQSYDMSMTEDKNLESIYNKGWDKKFSQLCGEILKNSRRSDKQNK
mmetsp:Transcript_28615/g.25326  ORF Transcript_28615/g.25326 Transcript_28615/m.25326 type:complete len:116 (-) Transcript_28615:130-477(-)